MSRITERRHDGEQYSVEMETVWEYFDHEPTDKDLDDMAKRNGFWQPGGEYPVFTIWLNGEDIAAGGGPNSGPMEDE